MASFLSPERRMGVLFFKNTFVNIFDFVNKSQSLIRKVSAARKKAKIGRTAI